LPQPKYDNLLIRAACLQETLLISRTTPAFKKVHLSNAPLARSVL